MTEGPESTAVRTAMWRALNRLVDSDEETAVIAIVR